MGIALLAVLLGGCGDPEPVTDPITAELPFTGTTAADCLDRYTLPAELTGADGLGHFGWSPSTLEGFTARWGVPEAHVTRWISDNANTGPSARVHVLRAPDVGQCVQDEIRTAVDDDRPLYATLRAATPFTHDDVDLAGLAFDDVQRPEVDLSAGNVLFRALWGARLDTGEREAPGGFGQQSVQDAALAWPEEAAVPLARLIIALGEARILGVLGLDRVDDGLVRDPRLDVGVGVIRHRRDVLSGSRGRVDAGHQGHCCDCIFHGILHALLLTVVA